MLSQLIYKARQVSRKLWVRAALISVLAILSLALPPLTNSWLPETFLRDIDEAKARSLLDILANSMLAVTTFSLTIMVTAHFAASSQVTPRAHRILRSDTRTQTVLATFIGAFVFALASIVMLQVGLLNQSHYPVVYLMTILVIALVIGAILRWIDHLSALGSMEETVRRVEEHARTAIGFRNDNPYLGGHRWPLLDALPEDAHEVAAPRSGFVQHIDSTGLGECAGKRGERAFLLVQPGDWIAEGAPLMLYDGDDPDEETEKAYADAFILGDTRTFVQDFEFGLIVMSEIAQRALSPAMNDPRTAIDVIARIVGLVGEIAPEVEPGEVRAPGVYARPMQVYPALENAFDPIARDGSGHREIQQHLQIAFRHLAEHRVGDVAEAARLLSRRALLYADAGLPLREDVARVGALAEDVAPRAAVAPEP